MRTFGMSVLAVLLALPFAGSADAAAKKKKAAAASAKSGPAPTASAGEIEKLKGDFKWGMSPDETLTKMTQRVEASYEERLRKTGTDPARHDRVQKQMRAEIERIKQNALVKFEGTKTGYDVSIIDQEFSHNTGESMLVAKEESASRYFFFADDRLYKMFIAFDKDMLEGKTFKDFGAMMQARFGKAREVFVDSRTQGGVLHKLDHYLWSTKGGDVLRLVDRSAFYDVYCLVIYDGAVAARQTEAGKANRKSDRSDALVEAITTKPINNRDENDNVIDRITGREVRRPGDKAPEDIQVPSPSSTTKAPSAREVNRAQSSDEDAQPAKGKGKGKESKVPSGLEL